MATGRFKSYEHGNFAIQSCINIRRLSDKLQFVDEIPGTLYRSKNNLVLNLNDKLKSLAPQKSNFGFRLSTLR
jgi:hypothetical protein